MTTGQAASSRAFLLQSLWLARLEPRVHDALRVGSLAAAEGVPALPTGFVSDLSAILSGDDASFRPLTPLPGFPPLLLRHYEDHVLARLIADARLDRAGAALRSYQPDERPRGVAFVLCRLCERLGLDGVELPPAVARRMGEETPQALLAEGYASLEADGPRPELVALVEQMISRFRRSADLLAPEDVLAIEQRTALGDLAQYVAHRQLLQLAARFEATLPVRPMKPITARREVPTRIQDEDQYPVGGYAAIGTRGSIESLLHSQLAYMERGERPDLFDVKFVRDELFYYTRDENQFLRRRRHFAIHFHGSLTQSRFKDPSLPAQRLVLAMALVLAAIRKLTAWLSEEALTFEITFDPKLAPERELFAIVLQQPLAFAESGSGLVITAVPQHEPQLVVAESPRFNEESFPGDGFDAWTTCLAKLMAECV